MVQQKLLPIICCHVKIIKTYEYDIYTISNHRYRFQNYYLEIRKPHMKKTALFSNRFNSIFWQRNFRGRHHLIILSNSLLYTTKHIVKSCELTEGLSTHDLLLLLFICFLLLLSKNGPDTLFLYMDRVKRIWYLSPMRAAKVQASLRIRAVSPEPLLLAHTSSESKGTFRQKARSLAPLNGWACAVKICHDGMLEDTN